MKAFQNVADVLRALQCDAHAAQSARAAERAAKKYLESGCPQLKFGGVWQLAFFDARRAHFIAANWRMQIEARYPTDTVAPFIALGGG